MEIECDRDRHQRQAYRAPPGRNPFRACAVWLWNHTLFAKLGANAFHTPAIHAQIGVADAGCRTHCNHSLYRSKRQVEVIDKLPYTAAAFRVEVVGSNCDQGSSRQCAGDASRCRPRLFQINFKLNGFDMMLGIYGIAAYTVSTFRALRKIGLRSVRTVWVVAHSACSQVLGL